MIRFSSSAVLILVLAAVCFADDPPATATATQPVYNGTVEDATAALAKAKTHLALEQNVLNDQITDSEELKKLAIELAAAEKIYDKAKVSGTMNDRMTTGAAANKIKSKIASIKAKMLAASGVPAATADVKAAEKDMVLAKAQAEQAKAAAAAEAMRAAPDPFAQQKVQAIAEHRVLIGMTMDQVKQAWPDAQWEPKVENENGKLYVVTRSDPVKEVYDLTFQKDKLTLAYQH